MNKDETEKLREKLLDDVYAGAFSSTPAIILDENKIKNASEKELKQIAKLYGY